MGNYPKFFFCVGKKTKLNINQFMLFSETILNAVIIHFMNTIKIYSQRLAFIHYHTQIDSVFKKIKKKMKNRIIIRL